MDLKMKPMICEQCGGHIDRRKMRCPYCGTEYGRENNGVVMRYRLSRPGETVIRSQVSMDYGMVKDCPEGAKEYALDRMRHEVADALLAFMKITTCTDYSNMCEIIRGEVRVIDPEFSIDY